MRISSHIHSEEKSDLVCKSKGMLMVVDNDVAYSKDSATELIRPFGTKPAEPDRYKLPASCGFCSEKATADAYFELDNCIVVRKYCDKCLQDAVCDAPRSKIPIEVSV
jgi:hypothetical protein